MLSRADATVAKNDPHLPGLPLLLNTDAFSAALQAVAPQFAAETAQATYVRYKRHTNCLVAYRLSTGGQEIDLYAKAFRSDDTALFENTQSAASAPIALNSHAVMVYPFPVDYGLTVLERLADEHARAPLLSKLFSAKHTLFRQADLHRLRYKPARRYVARLTANDGQQAVLKVYANDDYRTASYAVKAFKSHGALRIPRRIGRSTRHRMLALEWLLGTPLNQSLHSAHPNLDAVHAAGAALATLHTQIPKRLLHLARETEVVPLLSAAVGVSAVCPHLSERAIALATRLGAELLKSPRLHVPIHGDFSADQVVISPDGQVALIDFDQAVYADPAADLGSFLAQLERDSLDGKLTGSEITAIRHELFSGYQNITRRDLPPRIGVYVAAALLRLAPHPFRYRAANWPQKTEMILARAETILREESKKERQ